MYSSQLAAVVQGAAPLPGSDGVAQVPGLVEEERCVVRRRQALEHVAHGLRQTVVDLVAAGPEGVAAGRGQGVDLEHGVVGRDGLKGDVAVPAVAGEPADVGELVGQAAALLLLLRRDDADLVPELAAFFGQGVDVEG